MSGIFGIFQQNDQPVITAELQAMQSAMVNWGPDGSKIWRAGCVGLGSLLFHNTPEARYERLPRQIGEDQQVITAEARIDNRTELFDRLHIVPSERTDMPDSELIVRAYRQWGDACPEYLIGDWSFAIWQPHERKLFVARDHHGNTALYYFVAHNRFAFASSINALLSLPGLPKRLNELKLAQILTSWAVHGPPTIYEDLFFLPPAHSMTVTLTSCTTKRYWRAEDTPELTLPSRTAYVEGLLDVYCEAVRCRLRSYRPVAVTLSGGLDSGSVAVLAARELQQSGQRLPAFSSVPIYDVSYTAKDHCLGDESSLIKATAQQSGNIDLHFVRAEQTTPLDGIRRSLELYDSPQHAASNMYWLVALLQQAQQQQVGTLLTGQGGNGTISWPGMTPFPLLTLIQQGHWRQAVKRLLGDSLVDAIRGRHQRTPTNSTPWEDYSAIHPAFAQRIQLSQRMADAGHDPTFRFQKKSTQEVRYEYFLPGRDHTGALWAIDGAYYGLEVRDPTLDIRVISYCLSVPDWVYHHPNGQNRWLIREAMKGLLPTTVRENTKHGLQAADIVPRLVHDADAITEIIVHLHRSPLAQQYLDLERIDSVWQKLQQTETTQTQSQAQTILMRGVHVGLFLLDLEVTKQ